MIIHVDESSTYKLHLDNTFQFLLFFSIFFRTTESKNSVVLNIGKFETSGTKIMMSGPILQQSFEQGNRETQTSEMKFMEFFHTSSIF